MATRQRIEKLKTAKNLLGSSTSKKLTKDELGFLHQHGYKKQVFMFVHTEDDKQKAEGILRQLEDTNTIVMLVSKEDMKL